MDHPQFDEDILEQGTKAILKTRDGLLRAAVPSPLGSCVFINDVTMDEMFAALRKHKEIMKSYPRNGEGLEAFVDASDTGYTMNGVAAEYTNGNANGNTNGHTNGTTNGHTNGTANGHTNGTTNGHTNSATNGHANGMKINVINDDARNGTTNGDKEVKKTNGIKASTKHASAPEGVDGMQNGIPNTPITNGVH